MGVKNMPQENKIRSRELRKNQTDTEKALWYQLRQKQMGGFKFRRQAPIGNYIVDFVCFEKRLIVEADGGQHSDQGEYDRERSLWLEGQGFRILRFWNSQILKEMEGVKEVIGRALGIK